MFRSFDLTKRRPFIPFFSEQTSPDPRLSLNSFSGLPVSKCINSSSTCILSLQVLVLLDSFGPGSHPKDTKEILRNVLDFEILISSFYILWIDVSSFYIVVSGVSLQMDLSSNEKPKQI